MIVIDRRRWLRGDGVCTITLPRSGADPRTIRMPQVLEDVQFPCGRLYFEQPRRMFAFERPCSECVVVHNNWIMGTAAKTYRYAACGWYCRVWCWCSLCVFACVCWSPCVHCVHGGCYARLCLHGYAA
jgi:hypothetical protein